MMINYMRLAPNLTYDFLDIYHALRKHITHYPVTLGGEILL